MVQTVLLRHFAAEGGQSGIGVLGIDPRAMGLQLITFVILFCLLKRFSFDTIVRLLEERRHAIDDGIRLGREMEAEKARLDERVEATLRQARKESDRIIAEAHQEAGGIIKASEELAERKISGMLNDAHNK